MTARGQILPARSFGSTGLHLSSIGFGAWAVGGGGWSFSWGPQDDDQSIAAMRRAVERGVNWIDTAAVYGLGHSEEVIGRFLKQLAPADRPLVFTKGGLVWDDKSPFIQATRTLAPDVITRQCDESLRRLGVDRLDVYQFHWPDETGVPVEDSWATMLRLVEAGKIRHAGVSNFDAGLLDRCEALGHVQSLQSPFSVIRRDLANREIPWCVEHGAGVLAYSPMQSGLLTDDFSAARVAAFAADDWRRRGPQFQEPALSANLALRDALRPIARRHDVNVSSVAVAWVLAWPGVTAPIVGARSPEQVDGWIQAGSLNLTDEDLDEIAAAIARTGAGSGPARPPKTSG